MIEQQDGLHVGVMSGVWTPPSNCCSLIIEFRRHPSDCESLGTIIITFTTRESTRTSVLFRYNLGLGPGIFHTSSDSYGNAYAYCLASAI